mmetsp:Transcript_44563/g.111968  ORF Transcript_44563/g.111968 Transcript_44563/m.111968 type:complete len:261 (-) Transcript_44563:366-1148(-)
MRSLNSAFSSFLCSVASATDLSNALMPASRAAISSASEAIASLATATSLSSCDITRSKPFFLSSARSNCSEQYSFLCSSSNCSFLSTSTISSIILMTLSKPPWVRALFPTSAKVRKSRLARSWLRAALRAPRIASSARARSLEAAVDDDTCTRLAPAPGRVFLKRSSASSSLRTLMVSARATSSSALVFLRSSHSAVFVLQLFPSSSLNFRSAANASCVSARSAFICAIATPISPIASVFDSMSVVSASTSFFLAAMSAS